MKTKKRWHKELSKAQLMCRMRVTKDNSLTQVIICLTQLHHQPIRTNNRTLRWHLNLTSKLVIIRELSCKQQPILLFRVLIITRQSLICNLRAILEKITLNLITQRRRFLNTTLVLIWINFLSHSTLRKLNWIVASAMIYTRITLATVVNLVSLRWLPLHIHSLINQIKILLLAVTTRLTMQLC